MSDAVLEDVVFLGLPGAGKGTQAAMFCERYVGTSFISTGNLLRQEIRGGTSIGRKAAKIMDAGNLVDDELILELVKNFISKHSADRYIFDGFPRTMVQAKSLEEIMLSIGRRIGIVVHIDIAPEVVADRLIYRIICNDCNSVFNTRTHPPKRYGYCDACGSNNIHHRNDDAVEVMRERIRKAVIYNDELFTYYKQHAFTAVHEINGELDAGTIAEKIEEILSV